MPQLWYAVSCKTSGREYALEGVRNVRETDQCNWKYESCTSRHIAHQTHRIHLRCLKLESQYGCPLNSEAGMPAGSESGCHTRGICCSDTEISCWVFGYNMNSMHSIHWRNLSSQHGQN